MSDDNTKQLPAEKEVTTALPIARLPGNENNRASEKIEMQRATAQVLGSFQMALQRPRNAQECFDRIIDLCKNVYFAADALYVVPRGGGKAEGLTVYAAKEFARIWGNVDYGYIEHGNYETETQMEAYCYDIESNVRATARFSVAHERWANDKLRKVEKPQEIEEMAKARAAKEVRNCIFDQLGGYIYNEALKTCKRTLHQEVKDVAESWRASVKKYAEFGVSERSLMRYVDCSDLNKLTAREIVDLRVLLGTIKSEPKTLDTVFPEREKRSTQGSMTSQPTPTAKQETATPQPGKESSPNGQSSINQNGSVATEIPKPLKNAVRKKAATQEQSTTIAPSSETLVSSESQATAPEQSKPEAITSPPESTGTTLTSGGSEQTNTIVEDLF